MPDFSLEESFRRQGFKTVLGVDEVGRGCLAGPVVAGACLLKDGADRDALLTLGIDDSKRLTAERREVLAWIIPEFFVSSIGLASVDEINRAGIVRATARAMRRAIVNLKISRPIFILVDGYRVKFLPGGLKRQSNIIHGDQKSVSIAAASIIAKVYRDRLMKRLAGKFPLYNWGKNKGYGTEGHRLALGKYGLCRHHRIAFTGHLVINTSASLR
ncbi:MAG: ribonuclease HII, ribonuclease HII [Candidatus Gottesmanbacteria bacterium GW2011_GWA2_43_14]|uniref:Ribonuclease HII n=1 Tax=Candidatus Gottesmanbacteria bacterium GW2011_GWA2_43_14 TaxID=1618443 RepID=A0A0G1DDQ4_9BACT|nr:MAG: ribonuclease HII, ribonuclease HII [Candidatus Gottesmanbacteria bacterium GW2011_GWA2_43_14]